MNSSFRKALFAFGAAVALFGCGGGGSTTGTTGTTGTTDGATSGGSTNAAVAFQLNGFGGSLVGNVAASSAPQTVQVNVGGSVRTITNTIVPYDILSGAQVTVMSAGSQALNMQIADASLGVTFSGSTVHAPISSSGAVTSNIIEKYGVGFTTPPGTWQGYSLPNGLGVTLDAGPANTDVRASTNTSMKIASAGQVNGTTSISYSSPTNQGQIGAVLYGGDITVEVNGPQMVNATPSTSGNLTVPWLTLHSSGSGSTALSTASVTAVFSN